MRRVHHAAALSSWNTLDAYEPRVSHGDPYPSLTCMPCASEISSYEPPHAAAVVRNPNLNYKVCAVHHAAALSSWNALDAYEPRTSHGDRYPRLTCMLCASEISSYEPARMLQSCETLALTIKYGFVEYVLILEYSLEY